MLELLDTVGGRVDVVLSDMAPNIAGHYSTDHARSVELCMYAVDVCDRILKKNGKMVCKVFMGDMENILIQALEKRFQSVRIHSPAATRETSSEMYVISTGFLGKHNVKLKKLEAPEPGDNQVFTAKSGNF